MNDETKRLISVPLRGLWFLSICFYCTEQVEMITFPSPCGDYGSYLKSIF